MNFEREYKTISRVAGPLVVVDKIGDAAYNEVVRIRLANGETKLGQVLESTDKYAVVQIFGQTSGINVNDTSVSFLGETFHVPVSDEMLGRVFDGKGKPKDSDSSLIIKESLDINGAPINPAARAMPKDFIETGISAIDGLMTVIRGQKLPIFSSSGLMHNELTAQVARQARVTKSNEEFAVVFGGIGITHDDASFFIKSFEKTGALKRTVAFINLADDPSIERILTPRIALTTAEYLAYERDMHVLVILSDMTNYCFHGDTEIILADGTFKNIKDYVESLSDLNNVNASNIISNSGRQVQYLQRFNSQLSTANILSWKDQKTIKARVTAVQKIIAPKKLVSIKTRSGAELKVTYDHKILVDTLHGEELVAAGDLKKNMEIYSVRNFDVSEKDYNILELFSDCDANFYIHLKDDEIEKTLVKKYGSLKIACDSLNLNYNRVTEIFIKRAYTPSELITIINDINISLEEASSKINYITAGGKKRIYISEPKLISTYLRILGMICSDGTIYENKKNGSYYISFSNKKMELIEDFLKQVSDLFPYIKNQLHKNQDGIWIARINSRVLSHLFGKLFMKNNKQLLNPVFKMQKEHIAAFLAGYLDGDGSIPKGRRLIQYTTKDKLRAKRLQQLFKRLGIQSAVQKARYSEGNFSGSFVYDLFIRGKENVLRFSEFIEPHHPEKILALKALKEKFIKQQSDRSDYFDLTPLSCSEIFDKLRGRYELKINQLGASSTASQLHTNKRRLSRTILRRWLNKLAPLIDNVDSDYNKLCRLVDGNYILDRIIDIQTIDNIDQEFVYDFTVSDTHRIVAENGLITSNCESLRELSSAREEVPGRRGYPGYMYTDLASIYERAGLIKGKKGSITQLDILTMPGEDITHPIPDLTGYITEGQIYLSRELANRGIYPPINPLGSLSRLMNNEIGKDKTREDHRGVADQLYGSYAKTLEARNLSSIVGIEALSESDRQYLKFGEDFEKRFLTQSQNERRDINKTLDLGWELLSIFDKSELTRIKSEYIQKYYKSV